MNTRELLDPEILPVLDLYPDVELTRDQVPLLREQAKEQLVLEDPAAYDVDRTEVAVSSADSESTPVRCLLYVPSNPVPNNSVPSHNGSLTDAPQNPPAALRSAYLHLHGGGYLYGAPDMSDLHNLILSSMLKITILSVDYRLAPEHPIPAPLDDAYGALAWLHQNAAELRIDPQRIAVGGESAGGGLAAALAQRAVAAGEYSVCHQHLTYPMLDDRTGTQQRPASSVTGQFVWTRERNQFAWDCYLGDAARAAPQVPARAEDLSGLPKCWMSTADLDLFREENIAYSQALMNAGVNCELVVYPGACHAFQLMRDAAVSQRFFRDHLEALGRALS
ncbi:MAG: alpha/beta hydrolase [Pseudomonadota bacterium]